MPTLYIYTCVCAHVRVRMLTICKASVCLFAEILGINKKENPYICFKSFTMEIHTHAYTAVFKNEFKYSILGK